MKIKPLSAVITVVIILFGIGLFFFRDSGEIKKLFSQPPPAIARTIQQTPKKHWVKIKGEIERYKDKIVSKKIEEDELVNPRRSSQRNRHRLRELMMDFDKKFLAVYLTWKVGSVSDEEAVNYYFDHVDPEGPLRAHGFIWNLYRDGLGKTGAFDQRCLKVLSENSSIHREVQRNCAHHLVALDEEQLNTLLKGRIPSNPELLGVIIHHFIDRCRPVPKEYFQAWLNSVGRSPSYWINEAFPGRAAYSPDTLKVFKEKIFQMGKKIPSHRGNRLQENWEHARARAQKVRSRHKKEVCQIVVK